MVRSHVCAVSVRLRISQIVGTVSCNFAAASNSSNVQRNVEAHQDRLIIVYDISNSNLHHFGMWPAAPKRLAALLVSG